MSKMFNDLKRGLSEVDAFLSGQKEGFKVTVPEGINVKEIRAHLNMTQKRFSNCFGFSLDAIKHWEGGRRTPEAPVRAFLTVIARNPKAVMIALHPKAVTKTSLSKISRKRKTSRSGTSRAS